VQARISDGRVLALLDAYLKADILDGLEQWTPTGGTPQGAVISPLLANLYLHGLDCRMSERGYRIVRYADDFVILCRDETEARAALREVQAWCAQRGDSPCIPTRPISATVGSGVRASNSSAIASKAVDGGCARKADNALKDKIRAKTRRNRGDSLAAIIADLNPMLRGWFGYFKHAHRTEFPDIDGFVRRRLRAILRRHQHLDGPSRSLPTRTTNAGRMPSSPKHGLFTMTTAHALASQSR
jgi:RNA-directed DNA polymerase